MPFETLSVLSLPHRLPRIECCSLPSRVSPETDMSVGQDFEPFSVLTWWKVLGPLAQTHTPHNFH